MTEELKLIIKVLNEAYRFTQKQEQTKETGELLVNLYKARMLSEHLADILNEAPEDGII